MCGFLAVFDAKPLSAGDVEGFRAQSQRLQHRGNTSHGEWIRSHFVLFHYRLAFRDIKEGHQPLHSSSKQHSILFNGELYNFLPLRTRLKANYEFHTHSDTEVLLASYLANPTEFLADIDGEYAFAIWDQARESLLAARDPFGVKPLFLAAPGLAKLGSDFFRSYKNRYEFTVDGRIFVASEIKGLPFPLSWNRHGFERQMVGLYEEIGTAFENVIQLPPGALLRAEKRGHKWHCVIERKIPKHRKRSLVAKNYSFESAALELRKLLSANVKNKLDSEVPLGAYLSGGIDSRIAAFEASKLQGEISTFTVGFEGADFDESQDVAQFLSAFPNLKGKVLRTTNESLNYSYEHAVYHSELVQPYTNGCAKWWLSRFARRYVRGVITGDGADELFCGYPSYRYLAWWKFYQKHPCAKSLYAARVGNAGNKVWEKGLSSREDGSDLLASQKIWGWAHPLYEQYQGIASFLKGSNSSAWLSTLKAEIFSYIEADKNESPLSRWQNYFLQTHFPTHVLNWVGDRMEMANTLEGRPIYLSRSVLDLVRTLPDSALVRGMQDKAILRKAYAKELQYFSRAPKKQFNAPFLHTGALKEKYLSRELLQSAALIDPAQIASAEKTLQESSDPLLRSCSQMFLQNAIAAHILHDSLVKKNVPSRDLAYEEKFLDEHTTLMGKP